MRGSFSSCLQAFSPPMLPCSREPRHETLDTTATSMLCWSLHCMSHCSHNFTYIKLLQPIPRWMHIVHVE
ncbi:hypothetical protein CgunFtcFv8_017266 [Champsocephalus gunnari]|uniref:Uncharacterized protein n=1 Tax=Champsocephalus gunnari TaxID=52237 RepID=A0AAN8DK36_CHAGU|nr:hypothetical protein CgunFtcFv8_017266 [Champsocephalus gunnari]